MGEHRVRLEDPQSEYIEETFGDEFPGESEKFRALVREHRLFAQLLDLDLDLDHDELADELDD